MATWSEIYGEMFSNRQLDFFENLKNYIRDFSQFRNRNLIVYFSNWLNSTNSFNFDINDSDMVGFKNASKKLDKNKGLDIIIHTPGGDPLATDAIVKYLHKFFGDDIEVFIPHLAMSAGTMFSCSCKKIWMSNSSFLGPIDPQFNGIPAYNIKKDFEVGKKELIDNPSTFRYYQILLNKYPPAFYYNVLDAIKISSKMAKEWLNSYMFNNEKNKSKKVNKIVKFLNKNTGSHSKHLNIEECKKIGLKIEDLNNNSILLDKLENIYNCLIIIGQNTLVSKIITNNYSDNYITGSFKGGK